MTYQTINPATGKLIKQFDYLAKELIPKKINQAHEAFLTWKTWSFDKRAQVLNRVAQHLHDNAHTFAKLIELEMGKPMAEGEAEVKKCALVCTHYADHAQSFLQEQKIITEASKSYIRYDPLGIILVISPWNFPFWQVFRMAAPTLMAGNVMLLKHASNMPQCALAIEKIFLDAGMPKDIFTTLLVSHEEIEAIIANPQVHGVSLTGSTGAGAKVAELAGRYIKPCVLELGGSDPFLVFSDANIKQAAITGASSRCLNSGQSCINAKRFIIHKDSMDIFSQELALAMESYVMGPLATEQQREEVHKLVTDAINKGAKVLCGGTLSKGLGFFYPATVLTNINASMRVWHEEVFGPVASIFTFDTDDEALKIANGSQFGLGASLWTKDKTRIKKFCEELECGTVFVNQMVRSDPRLPFGGIKHSGFGRELGREGILSFVNTKSVWLTSVPS